MDRKIFKKKIRKELDKLDKEQLVKFAWLCAVRALPFLGKDGNFDFWKEEERSQYLYSILFAIDISGGINKSPYSIYEYAYPHANAAYKAAAATYSDYSGAAYTDAAYTASAFAAAYAANTAAYTYSATYAADYATDAAVAAGESSKIAALILEDLEILKNNIKGKHNHDLSIYGKVWSNFQKALEAEDCSYWGSLYQNIFENGFIIDKTELQHRIEVPIKLQNQGASEVAKYLKQVKIYGTQKAYEARVLIVGEPNAGKTTLRKLLFDRNQKVPLPESEQPATLGVEVALNRLFKNPKRTMPDIKTHIWDFGGQDIQYMLHQYFMSDDALYILITDGRSGKTRYSYWFHIISLLAPNSPVLVVLNRHKDSDTVITFDAKRYKEEFPNLKIENAGEIDFGALDSRWDFLEKRLAEKLVELPVVEQEILKPWIPIRLELEKHTEKYILLQEYDLICERHGLKGEKESFLFLKYLHKIGIALNFDDPSLQNIVFLDPNWITHAIYDALSDAVVDKNGQFDRESLYLHWKDKNCNKTHQQVYSQTECNYLLNLMLKDKFNLCYPLAGSINKYIVPLKLPDRRPEYEFDSKNNLRFRYQYPFMPEGIFSRIIVRLYEYIHQEKVWLSGVILHKNSSMAEIVQHETSKEGLKYIGIRVNGSILHKRQLFLHDIREQIEHIHRTDFKYINVSEMVVCNCPICNISQDPKFYPKEELRSYIEGNENTIFCTKGLQHVNIQLMMNEVYFKEKEETEMKKVKIFISYSSNDCKLMALLEKELNKHLHQDKKFKYELWSDKEIDLGDNWEHEIDQALNDSDAAILLISPSFASSPYILEKELEYFKKKSEAKYLIMPVLVREYDISQFEDVAKLQFFKTYRQDYFDLMPVEWENSILPFDALAEVRGTSPKTINDYVKKLSDHIQKAVNKKYSK